MQLFYNGQTYTYTAVPCRVLRPRAINWRYLVPGEVVEPSTPIARSHTPANPLAVNWRYQLPEMQ